MSARRSAPDAPASWARSAAGMPRAASSSSSWRTRSSYPTQAVARPETASGCGSPSAPASGARSSVAASPRSGAAIRSQSAPPALSSPMTCEGPSQRRRSRCSPPDRGEALVRGGHRRPPDLVLIAVDRQERVVAGRDQAAADREAERAGREPPVDARDPLPPPLTYGPSKRARIGCESRSTPRTRRRASISTSALEIGCRAAWSSIRSGLTGSWSEPPQPVSTTTRAAAMASGRRMAG